MIRAITLLCITSLVIPGMPAAAQDTEKTKLTFNTLCVSWPDGITSLFCKEGEKYSEVELPLNNLSDDYKADISEGLLRFYLPEVSPDKNGTIYKEVVSAKVPVGSRGKMLALFVPTGDKAKPFVCMMISLDLNSFRGGDRLMFNLTDTNVAGSFLGKKFKVPKGGRYTLTPARQGTRDPESIVLYSEDPGTANQWKPFVSGMWINDPMNRTLLFFFKKANGGMSYREVPQLITE